MMRLPRSVDRTGVPPIVSVREQGENAGERETNMRRAVAFLCILGAPFGLALLNTGVPSESWWLVAAAPLVVPEELIKQLKVGGRLLVPVGAEGEQELIRFTRKEQRVERQSLGAVAFVPLLGGTT